MMKIKNVRTVDNKLILVCNFTALLLLHHIADASDGSNDRIP